MNEAISLQQLQNLRQEFRRYLRKSNPEWNDSTISTQMSDAFFLFNNNIGVDVWTCLISEESMLTARNQIRDYYANEKNYDNPDGRVAQYLSSLGFLKAFLDEYHPTLAQDWSGKTVSEDYLRTAFKMWMGKQRKSNGELYAQNTVGSYVSALKNYTVKLKLEEEVYLDLFYYITLDEFADAHNCILKAPNFEEIDKKGNASYSNAMNMYTRFLKEFGESCCWIFQGNPKHYDVVSAIEAFSIITWAVNQSISKTNQRRGSCLYLDVRFRRWDYCLRENLVQPGNS